MGEFFEEAKGADNNAGGKPQQGANNLEQYQQESLAVADPLFAEASVAPHEVNPVPGPSSSNGITSPCDNAAPGSHVEAACHGPTADNPSFSIQNRLKRARFFDKRELQVAAGEAAPMESDAGLPDAMEPVSPRN